MDGGGGEEQTNTPPSPQKVETVAAFTPPTRKQLPAMHHWALLLLIREIKMKVGVASVHPFGEECDIPDRFPCRVVFPVSRVEKHSQSKHVQDEKSMQQDGNWFLLFIVSFLSISQTKSTIG